MWNYSLGSLIIKIRSLGGLVMKLKFFSFGED